MKKLLLIIGLMPILTFGQFTLQDSLIAYYPFTGNTQDQSGNGNHATNNGASLTSDRFGHPNCAYDFNGTSDYITTAKTFDFEYRTISVWINADTTARTGLPGNQNEFWAFSQDAGSLTYGSAFLRINQGVMSGRSGGESSIYNYGNVNQNKWYHVAMVRDGSKTYYYWDGNYISSGNSGSAGSTSNPNPIFVIGSGRTTSSQFFDGKIDDLRIYNRALSGSEINDLYNETPASIESNPLSDNKVKVYPNPANDRVNVVLDAPVSGCTIRLIDNLGRTVYESVETTQIKNKTISLQGYANGVYSLVICNTDNYRSVNRVVISK